MNSHEEKQAARKERFEELAQKNAAASNTLCQASRRATAHIPFGQPILVGHHSEGRHRADVKRSDTAMRKAIEAQNKAEYYERKAAGVGRGGVSSDDPDAIEKLRAQVVKLKADQDLMKAANKTIRTCKGDSAAKIAALGKLGFTPEVSSKLLQGDFAGRIGFADYKLTNNNASIKRIEKRIKELEATHARESKTETGAGYEYQEDAADNRVSFSFDGKPSETIRTILKANGFRWSPTRMAWIRYLNNTGLYHAQIVRAVLDQQPQGT